MPHPLHRAPLRTVVLSLLGVLILGSGSAQAAGSITYVIEKSAAPTADELDAYTRIQKAMDSALFHYNRLTTLRKSLRVQYVPGVATADANSNGVMRFGSNRTYMSVITAMHETSHTLGVGTTAEYAKILVGGVLQAPKATAALRAATSDPAAQMKGDAMHMWPYGLNFASEVKSVADLEIHCRIMEGLYQDMFQESVAFEGRIRSRATGACMLRVGNGLALGSCSDSLSLVRLLAMGATDPTYRLEFGDRVLDTPNQSSVVGLTLGLYTWNGGNHQRLRFTEGVPKAGTTARLALVHSGLELRAQGSAVLQDATTTALDARTWEFVANTVSVPARRTHPAPAPAGLTVDALGRRGMRPADLGWKMSP
jgi:hypothetical protein